MADLRQHFNLHRNKLPLLRIFLSFALVAPLFIISTSTSNAVVVPPAPTLTTSSASTSGATRDVTLNFTGVDSTTVVGFKYSTDNGVTWHECTVGGRCNWTKVNNYIVIQKLSSGTSSMGAGDVVELLLKACSSGSPNSNGNGLDINFCSSASNLLTYKIGTPSQPRSVTANVISSSQIDVSWLIPTDNGGEAISDYWVQYSTDGNTWETFTASASTSLSRSVTGLTSGTGYYFRVAAKNSSGYGAFSSVSSLYTTASAAVPETPTVTSVGSATISSLTVTWTAPANGGAAITDYLVQFATDTITWDTFTASASTSLSRTVTGLTSGTGYYFRVAAKNSVGYGPFSESSTIVSTSASATVPETPTAISAGSPTKTSLSVSWTAPANGGDAITDYWLQYSTNGGTTWETFTATASASASRSVTGLSASTAYTFRVAAKNSIGFGPFSDSSTSVSTSSEPTPGPEPEVIPAPKIIKVSKVKVCSRGGDQILIQGNYLRNSTITLDGLLLTSRGNSNESVLVILQAVSEGVKTLKVQTSSGSATTTLTFKNSDRTAFKVFDIPYIYKGGEFRYTFEAFGENTFRVTGNFPAGLTLDETTGEISGTPTEDGIFNFVIHADGVCGNDSDVIRLDIDKSIPNAISHRIKFPNKRNSKIGATSLHELKKFLEEVKKISPRQIEPVIYISGGAPEGEAEVDSEEAKARRDALCDVLLTQDILAQTIAGIFSGDPDEIEIFVYWPVPR